MKLLYTEAGPWSIQVGPVYADWQQRGSFTSATQSVLWEGPGIEHRISCSATVHLERAQEDYVLLCAERDWCKGQVPISRWGSSEGRIAS